MLKKLPISIALFASACVAAASADDSSPDRDAPVVSKLDLFGVVQTDYSRISGDDTGYDLSDVEVRRGRIGLSGVLFGDVKFKAELDIDDPNDPEMIDAYIEFQPGGMPAKVQLGQFKTANSLDEQTSSKRISTLERAAFTDAFGFGRGVGIGLTNSGERHTVTLGVFGQDLEQEVFEGYALAGRATYEPVANDDLKIHTGVSFRYRDLDASQALFKYAQGPVAAPAEDIVSTGRIAQSDLFIGGELALTKGRYWGAAEYGATIANCGVCLGNPVFAGGYVEAGVVFGGNRPLGGGTFGAPSIESPVGAGGAGAVDFVARFDALDLTDGGVNGGEYNSITLGGDWWPIENVRLGLNLYRVHAEFGYPGAGLDPVFESAIASGLADEDAYGMTFRLQIHI